jgi:hypothetical protein
MKSRLPLFRIPRCLSGLLIFCGTGLVAASGHAATSPLAWEDLQFQMNQHVKWWRIYLETEVQVFDPLQTFTDAKGKFRPVERPARRYRQRIHWKADEAIIVESLGFQQRRLHVHLEYKDNYADTVLHPGFDWHETSPWYLRLLGRNSQNREQTLWEYGLSGFDVTLQLTEDSHAFYRVGHPESGAYALIQPVNFQIHSLHREVQQPDGTVWQLEVRFSKFKIYRKQAYPQVTEYLLDGKLHKRVTVTKLEYLQRIPVTDRSTALQPFAQPMTSLALDHAR